MNRSPHAWIAPLVTLVVASACTSPEAAQAVAEASSVGLVNTHWRLTELGGQVLTNPEGTDAIGLQLQAQNARVVGFSGCNRMFGGYVLEANTLKFAQMGGTRMACAEQERMHLEQQYLEMFSAVARWKITGSTLQLLDANGSPVATFAASPSGTAPGR